MFVKFLYAAVAVLILVVGWQSWSHHRINAYLEQNVAAQSYGASEKDARITVLAFMDYTCRACKETNPYLMQVVAENPDMRVIFHPLPQPGELSQKAARFALAAAKQGKFIEMHEELMRNERPVSDAVLRDIAEKLRLDYDRLQADSQDPAVTERLDHTLAIALKLGLDYTPSFIFNRKLIYVAMRPEMAYGDFLQLIQRLRT